MKDVVFFVTITILVILFFFTIFNKKIKSKNKDEVYICNHCGERDCICHKKFDAS